MLYCCVLAENYTTFIHLCRSYFYRQCLMCAMQVKEQCIVLTQLAPIRETPIRQEDQLAPCYNHC